MRVQVKIKKWGNSLGLRLSGPLKSLPQFSEDMLVNIEVSDKGLMITPAVAIKGAAKLPYTEEQLLAGLDAHTAHADELPTLLPKEFGE